MKTTRITRALRATTTLRLIAATFFILHIAFFIGIARAASPAPAVSIATLLDEMTNRDSLARFPEPAFTCRQFSSYDRASVAKDQPGWFANDDRSWFLRVEHNSSRREFVMLDTDGPGAIVRFWMTFSGTNSGRGSLRVYIDNNPVPAIEGSAFGILSGSIVTGPPLAESVSKLSPYEQRGHNLYFPIPYAKHCKITYESEHLREDDPGAKKPGTECVYYNINYRTYGPAVNVISYSADAMRQAKPAIDAALKLLSENKKTIAPGGATHRLDATLQPGESTTITLTTPVSLAPSARQRPIENRKSKIENSLAIQHIAMRLEAPNQEQALRSTILEIAFDGQKTVWVPVGDFFGIGYMRLHASTWFTEAGETGLMQSWWVMPFAKNCTLTLRNLGTQTVRIADATVDVKPWKWDGRSMHFGAGWRQYTRIPAMPGERAVDLNFANLEGKGLYVGDGIALFNTGYKWWGEGDEKVYVDGEKFPSHFGTGTEDYYGYAWARPEAFTGHPFIAQPCGAGSYAPRYTTNTRLRSLDAIPFTKSLRFDMELWSHLESLINYAPAAFWYMLPGGRNLNPDDPVGAREPVALTRADILPPAPAKDTAK